MAMKMRILFFWVLLFLIGGYQYLEGKIGMLYQNVDDHLQDCTALQHKRPQSGCVLLM
jgi:hypothetical protein